MPRTARIVVTGCPHHVTQKGNCGQEIFFSDEDRRVFLALLSQYANRHGLAVEGYCLMSNHVHLIATPEKEDSLAVVMGRTNFRYAQYVNRTYQRTGHLWQNRFYSCALDEAHYWAALVYVEQNPLRAGIVRVPWRHRWSSAAVHCGETGDSGLIDMRRWRAMANEAEWKKELSQIQPSAQTDQFRQFTKSGRPLGSAEFIAGIERALSRRVHALPGGRPRNKGRKN